MRPLFNQLPSSAGHLANSLLNFYTLAYEKEEHSPESAEASVEKCSEALEMYIASRSRDSQWILLVIPARFRTNSLLFSKASTRVSLRKSNTDYDF